MKVTVTFVLCILAVPLTLIFRSKVYDFHDFNQDIAGDKGIHQESTSSITVHYHERSPYYISYDSGVHGLVADPISMAFEYAEIPFQWIKTPAERQLDIIRNNDSKTCAAGWFKTPEREIYAKFSVPVYRDKPYMGITRADSSLFSHDSYSFAEKIQEAGLRLLVKSGYSYGAYIDQFINDYSQKKVVTTADNHGILRMVLAQRAEVALLTEEEAYDPLLFSKLNRNSFKLIRFSDFPAGNLRYLICSRKVEDADMESLSNAISRLNLVKLEEE